MVIRSSTTLTAKADWPNGIEDITDHGAVADGAFGSGTDSTAAFQAAVDAVAAFGGGTVLIPPGAWRVTSPIVVPSNVSFLGFGEDSQLLMDNDVVDGPYDGMRAGNIEGDGRGMFRCFPVAPWSGNPPYTINVRFENFRITGNNNPYVQEAQWQSAAIDLSNFADGVHVTNVTFEYLHGFGIHGRGYGSGLNVSQCRFNRLGNSAVNTGISNATIQGNSMQYCEGVELTGVNVSVMGNQFAHCGDTTSTNAASPVIVAGGNVTVGGNYPGGVIMGNSITDSTGGISVGANATDYVVSGNTIIRVRGFGIILTQAGVAGQGPHRTIVANNVLRSVGADGVPGVYGIYISNGDDVVCEGNSLSLNFEAGYGGCLFGIRCDSSGGTVRNNRVAGASTRAFYSRNTTDLLFEGNIVDGGNATFDYDSTVTFRGSKPYGSHAGTTAQRPTLGTTDAGYQFYDSTVGGMVVWTGTAWISTASGSVVTVPITGDGATTVFTVNHNLGLTTPFIPLAVTALDPSGAVLSASSYQIGTSAANSFVVTFAVAPANGAVHRFKVAGESASAAPTTTPGGATTQVQYNNAGAFTGNAAFTFDGSALVTVPGLTATGAISQTGAITPAALTADANDYAPAGFATASLVRVSCDQPYRAITGLAGGTDGALKTITNVGSQPLQLRSQSTGSTAANRFALPADVRVDPNAAVAVRYDGTLSRWVTASPAPYSRIDPGSPVELADEFLAQSIETGEIGELGWSVSTGSVTPVGANSLGSVLGVLRYTTNATANSVNSMFLPQGAFNGLISAGDIEQMCFRLRPVTTGADFTIRFGFFNDLSIATPTAGFYFERLSTDTTWFAVCTNASTSTRTAMATMDGNFHTFLIRQSGSTVTFQIDRTGAAAPITTNLPAAASVGPLGFFISPTTTTARSFDVDWFSLRTPALPARW